MISSAGQFLFHNPPIATISEVLQPSGDCGNLGFLQQPMPETVSVPQLAGCNNLKSFNHLGFLQQASLWSTTHRLQCSIFLQDPGFLSRPVSVPTHRLQQTSSDHLGFFRRPVSIRQLTDCNKLSFNYLGSFQQASFCFTTHRLPQFSLLHLDFFSRPVSVPQVPDSNNLWFLH